MTDEAPVTPAESVLPQDLIAQFTTDEAGIIREAIRDRGPEVWILWQVLMAQCEPMVVTNARFLLGWNWLRQLLGAVHERNRGDAWRRGRAVGRHNSQS